MYCCFQRGFIAQLVEPRTEHRRASYYRGSWVRILLEPQIFFLGFICNCLSYFITVCVLYTRITFTDVFVVVDDVFVVVDDVFVVVDDDQIMRTC